MSIWIIGVDVSKRSLDVCALCGQETKRELRFQNSSAGIKQLLAFAKSLGQIAAFGMESTGGYELDLALAALEAGLPLSVENPRRIKKFAGAMGYLNKTDRADARAIAQYLLRIGATPWRLSEPHVRELSLLTRHRASLLSELGRTRNRLEHARHLPELVCRQLQTAAARIAQDIQEIDERRVQILQQNKELGEQAQALMRIKGIGPATAILVLAQAGDVQNFENAQTYAANAGLSPCRKESGAWRGASAISKCGNRQLRAGLFMAASIGSRFNPVLKEFRKRLLERGKTKMQAIVACMRKLLMICYGVLKALRNGKQPFYGPIPA